MRSMEIEIKLKKKTQDALTQPYTVPVSVSMKEKLNKLKDSGVDLNDMTRDFFSRVIEETDDAKVIEQRRGS
jgi:hypothetical protein